MLQKELYLMLPRRCGTDQETNLYTEVVWWAVSLSRLTHCASSIPVAFYTQSITQYLMKYVSVAWLHLASKTEEFPRQMGVLFINTLH